MKGLGVLLHGQGDVQPHRLGADVVRAAIGGFHDPRPAARHHGEVGLALGVAVLRDQPGELAGHVVVAALGHDPLGLGHRPLTRGIAGLFGQLPLGLLQAAMGLGRFHDPRAAENHDRVLRCGSLPASIPA